MLHSCIIFSQTGVDRHIKTMTRIVKIFFSKRDDGLDDGEIDSFIDKQQKLRNDTWMEQTKLVFFYQGKLLAKSATKIKHRDPTVPVVSWSNICNYDMFPSIALATVAERGKQQVTSSMQQGNISN
ncbi:hypothetical protein LOK49_LG10G02500 [Camellia lanceoleosa]|uniref:Uncharacterized protein n=1 Tax=Camellia lanceoleosa TaxID=1840588 RepID=A0ACC0GD15_9ERIC|nr:hypothetical protein LOK49_LG10G02500 [Camellia lanceoleosa]